MSPPSHERPTRLRRLAAWAWGRPDADGTPYMTRGARYSTVFLFLFSLAIGGANLLFTSTLVHRTQAANASVTQLCESGNEFRHEQVQLWEYLIAASHPPPHETPAEKAQRKRLTAAFIAHIHKVFAPRTCP